MINTYSNPNYFGELLTADVNQTPLLSMVGGLGGTFESGNEEFPTAQLYEYPTAAQPSISEQASITAPVATDIKRSQEKNVTQIFHETIEVTYVKESNMQRLEGLNTGGKVSNPPSEKAWQISRRLIKIARDVEHTLFNGQYQNTSTFAGARQTRGLFELCSTGNTIAAASAAIDMPMLKALYKMLADSGAYLDNMVIFVNSTQKQRITSIYESTPGFGLPQTRSVGGLNISEIETDFFKAGVAYSRFVPQDSLIAVDVSHVGIVTQPTPGKGNFFEEELAKVGAADRLQIFGQLGLAHGPAFLHASITGLDV